MVFAEASFPSTGMGIELQIAASNRIPVVICFRKDSARCACHVTYESPDHSQHVLQIGEGFVSPMALGLPSLFKTVGYSTENEGIDAVVDAVNILKDGHLRWCGLIWRRIVRFWILLLIGRYPPVGS